MFINILAFFYWCEFIAHAHICRLTTMIDTSGHRNCKASFYHRFIGAVFLSEIPSSILVQRFGPKNILLISITLSAIVTVLTPLAIAYGTTNSIDFFACISRVKNYSYLHLSVLSLWISGEVNGLIATRVILGLVQGPVFPCFSAFIVPWYPVDQRGKLCSIGYIGISV